VYNLAFVDITGLCLDRPRHSPGQQLRIGIIMPEQRTVFISAEGVEALLKAGNIAQAEIFCQTGMGKQPGNPHYHYYMGVIAMTVHHPVIARQHFRKAVRLAPGWDLPRACLAAVEREAALRAEHPEHGPRYLLVKAWGYGFWSDVDHVLGQLLVAEMTGRIPVIHWGSNSRFGDGSATDHFRQYFEPVSALTIADLDDPDLDFFPRKWHRHNLLSENVNKFAGPDSCMAALYGFTRPERVVVSDFHTGILNILPWLPSVHPDYCKGVDEVYRRLLKTWLHPLERYNRMAEDFVRQSIGTPGFISVHMRGTDKVREVGGLDEINRQYFAIIDAQRAARGNPPVFLMTDDTALLQYVSDRYGDAVVTTDCTRASDRVGLHYGEGADGYRLGEEILLDTCIAIRGAAFVGHGFSNPSAMISHLKDWGPDDIRLIGPSIHHRQNLVLHERPVESLDPARAARVWSPDG